MASGGGFQSGCATSFTLATMAAFKNESDVTIGPNHLQGVIKFEAKLDTRYITQGVINRVTTTINTS